MVVWSIYSLLNRKIKSVRVLMISATLQTHQMFVSEVQTMDSSYCYSLTAQASLKLTSKFSLRATQNQMQCILVNSSPVV